MCSDKIAIKFEQVSKSYRVSTAFDQGIKGYLLNIMNKNYVKQRTYSALEKISFEIKRGESFGLIGKNGAGKSTTLGLIAKVIYPSEGKIDINGRVAPLLELGAGFHSDLTGRENIFINGVLLGLTIVEIKERMEEIIEFSGLQQFIDLPMRTYSTGMYMRLGFSVAVNINPDILLVDEVLSVGDAEFQAKCVKKINEFRNQGVTIVFVSHDLITAEKVCDQVAYLEHGCMLAIGKPQEVIEFYRNGKN